MIKNKRSSFEEYADHQNQEKKMVELCRGDKEPRDRKSNVGPHSADRDFAAVGHDRHPVRRRRCARSNERGLGTWFPYPPPVRRRGRSTTESERRDRKHTYFDITCSPTCSPSSRTSRPRRCCSSSSSTPRLTEKSPPRQISTSTLHSDHCVHYYYYYTSTVLPNLLLLLLSLLYYHYYYTTAPVLENVHSVSRRTVTLRPERSKGTEGTSEIFGNFRGQKFLQNSHSINRIRGIWARKIKSVKQIPHSGKVLVFHCFSLFFQMVHTCRED